jgi:hypothetical protein
MQGLSASFRLTPAEIGPNENKTTEQQTTGFERLNENCNGSEWLVQPGKGSPNF